MRLLSTLVFVGAASASAFLPGQRSSLMALKGIMERQVDTCVPVPPPYTCERSCGPGNVACISFPTCYNPGRGETCCSDGSYCPAGSYCTNAGCCPNGTPLAECGATISLSVIPPPATEAPSTSTSPAETTTSEATTAASTTDTSTTSYALPSSTHPSNSTTTTKVPVVTAGAGQNAGLDVLAAIGGLGALLMAL